MGLALVCLGLLFVLAGVVTLFARDLAWSLHKWHKRYDGVVHLERTEEWELRRGCSGLGWLLMGLFVAILGCSEMQKPPRREADLQHPFPHRLPPDIERYMHEHPGEPLPPELRNRGFDVRFEPRKPDEGR